MFELWVDHRDLGSDGEGVLFTVWEKACSLDCCEGLQGV